MRRSILVFVEPRRLEIHEEELAPPGPGEVVVRTAFSAPSPGTELLLYRGQAPSELAADDTLPSLSGRLGYPLRYGYAATGQVEQMGEGVDPGWEGRAVFAFHPHASAFVARLQDLVELPPALGLDEATLLANMESAVSFAMDARPAVGERVAVFGQGLVGLLATWILARFPLARLVTVERHPLRRDWSRRLGAHDSLDPAAPGFAERLAAALGGDHEPSDADLVIEVSGQPEALEAALDVCGEGGRLVVASWYGNRPVALNLGGRFHRSGIQIRASQVSRLAPEWRGRWTKARRLRLALDRLTGASLGGLLTHRVPFTEAPEAYRLLDERPQETIAVLLEY